MRIYEITKPWVKKNTNGVLPLTDENLRKAREFVFVKWKERAQERGDKIPEDLAKSCKFSTLFIKKLFGGSIQGNVDHQYNVIDGKIIDINKDAKDVLRLENPYNHDPKFFGNPEHMDSMKTCIERVNIWVEEFKKGFPKS